MEENLAFVSWSIMEDEERRKKEEEGRRKINGICLPPFQLILYLSPSVLLLLPLFHSLTHSSSSSSSSSSFLFGLQSDP